MAMTDIAIEHGYVKKNMPLNSMADLFGSLCKCLPGRVPSGMNNKKRETAGGPPRQTTTVANG